MIKGYIIYLPEYENSVAMARRAYESGISHGWDLTLFEGVNGHKEMANAFNLAGFECYDVNTNDVIANPALLNEYHGLVACGGFSYGDVLGAGHGWANKVKSLFFSK